MKLWPFLFSRGLVLDSQLIVCPRVLKEGGRWGEFSRIVAQLPSAPGQGTNVKEVQNSKIGGSVTLIYRETYASRNGQPARDVAGRSVPEIRGLMIQGKCQSKAAAIAEAAMLQAAPLLDNAFDTFWDQTEENGPAFSESFELGAKLPPPEMEERQRTKSRRTAAAAALAALVPFVVMGALFFWHYSATTKRLSDLEATSQELHGALGKLKQDVEELKGAKRPQ